MKVIISENNLVSFILALYSHPQVLLVEPEVVPAVGGLEELEEEQVPVQEKERFYRILI